MEVLQIDMPSAVWTEHRLQRPTSQMDVAEQQGHIRSTEVWLHAQVLHNQALTSRIIEMLLFFRMRSVTVDIDYFMASSTVNAHPPPLPNLH